MDLNLSHLRAGISVVVVLLLIGAPASAADSVKIRGGGWGHGIGMSQYGAYGRAKRGDGAPQILEHYYSGSNVTSRDMPRRIRVGLAQHRKEFNLSSTGLSGNGKVLFKVAGSNKSVATGGAEATWRIEASDAGGIRIFKDGEQVKENGDGVFGDTDHPLVLLYDPYGTAVHVQEKQRDYALGRMEFDAHASDRCNGFCVRLIVVLSMQHYLYGLGEVPASWPQAALRSQAIAGRTYAYDKVQRSGQHREPCDCAVFDSTYDQAYIGDEKRTGSGQYWDDWKRAVDATKSKVVIYDGDPIQALYSSSSGGHTENNENVWGGTPLPYLRGVVDKPDDNSANPNFKWDLEMSFSEFENKLQSAFHMGQLKDFELVRPFGVSGRVTVVKSEATGGVRIVGSEKTVRESGWTVRNALGLKDTLFRVEIQYGVGEVFAQKYRKLNGKPGRPTGDPYTVPRKAKKDLGRAQNFQHGRMVWQKTTGKVTWQWGRVLRKYNKLGRERSDLGMPTSDVWGPGSYLGASYVHGLITWSKQTRAHTVRGGFRNEYTKRGGPQGSLGLPTTNRKRVRTLPGGGLRQRFTNGTIFFNPETKDVFSLWGLIDHRYRKIGEARSVCGYPTAPMESGDSGATAKFENGTISTDHSGKVEVDCRS